MDKKMTAAILGCGDRGYCYTELLLRTGKYNVVALCDYNSPSVVCRSDI